MGFPAGGNEQEIVRSALLGAQRAARTGGPEAARAQLDFVRVLLNELRYDPEQEPMRLLREAMLGDGYQVTWDREASGRITYRLLPTDPTAVPVGREISALEADLDKRGYETALRHYQQAVKNLLQHNYEAANSQLRCALEDVVLDLAKTRARYVGQKGGEAINSLVTGGHLPEAEGGLTLRGVWMMSHPRGSHPGLSDADEARIRMQLVTASLRLLLKYFP